jgi:hypothetical protein
MTHEVSFREFAAKRRTQWVFGARNECVENFRSPRLTQVSLTWKESDICVLLYANEAQNKTTFMQILCGLLTTRINHRPKINTGV